MAGANSPGGCQPERSDMDLKCYVFPGWEPRIRPASAHRRWMDVAPEAFPYRCLPLGIANSHGWEVLSPCGFEASWNGGPKPEDVTVRVDPNAWPHQRPVTLFGLGTFTIHVEGVLRTPPGWNLFVSGPPNCAKDGAAPLTGVIETDWSPYTFTMNWKLTRPGLIVRFEENEPIAHFFPVERKLIEQVAPRFVSIDDDPELKAAFHAWSASRDAFQRRVCEHPPEKPADKWQKFYYRGLMPDGTCPIADHKAKLRALEFADAAIIQPTPSPEAMTEPDAAPRATPLARASALPSSAEADWKIAKYEWLLETMERQRTLSSDASGIYRVRDITAEEFLDNFYAPGRPVILCGMMDEWPARMRWSPSCLCDRIGKAMIECQSDRRANPRFERDKDAHRQTMHFDDYIEAIAANSGNDLYMTAYNSAANAAAMTPLLADLGAMAGILDHAPGEAAGMIWIGPGGTFTPLHHDLTNNLLAQIVGRKRVIMAAPNETPKLYNDLHVFSEVANLADPGLDLDEFPRLSQVRTLDVILEPGEMLFLPIGWWHQVEALDFSVSMTYTNFVWRNDSYLDHPKRG